MKEIVLFLVITTCGVFGVFFIVALICLCIHLMLGLIKHLYDRWVIGSIPTVSDRKDLIRCIDELLNSLKTRYASHILLYLFIECLIMIAALLCVYVQNNEDHNIAEPINKITIDHFHIIAELPTTGFGPIIAHIPSLITILIVIAATIFFINRILQNIQKLNSINTTRLKIISYIKMYHNSDNKNENVDTSMIQLEIKRLVQKLNTDSSRDIWHTIFNSN